MSADVTIAVAGDPIEAEEIRAVLRDGGIESTLESAEVEDAGPLLDGPCRVLVPEDLYERALAVLEDEDDDEDDTE
jgi:hypothetical protein